MNTILSTVIILGTYAWEKNSFFPFFFSSKRSGFWTVWGWGCGGVGDPLKHWALISVYRKKLLQSGNYMHQRLLLCRNTWWNWTILISKPGGFLCESYFSQLPESLKHLCTLSFAPDCSRLLSLFFPDSTGSSCLLKTSDKPSPRDSSSIKTNS